MDIIDGSSGATERPSTESIGGARAGSERL